MRGIVGHNRVPLGIHLPGIATLAHVAIGVALAILVVGCCTNLVACRGWLGKHIMPIALGLFAAFPASLATQNTGESWLNTFIGVLLCAVTVAIGVEYKREWFERHARGIFSAIVAASLTYASFRYIGVSPRIGLAVSVATGCGAGLIAEGGVRFPPRGALWWGLIVTYLTAPFTVYALGYAVPPGDLSPSIALTYKGQGVGNMVCGPLLGASDKYWYVLEQGRVVPVPADNTVPIAITGAISTSTTSGPVGLAACPTGRVAVRAVTTPVSRPAVRRARETTAGKT